MVGFISVNAKKYTYSFHNTPVSKALVQLGQDHPDIDIAFIYKELDNYTTSAKIDTDDISSVLRQIIGLNPVSIIQAKDIFYIEALQHGKYVYTGRVIGTDNEPVVAAIIMLLAPKDSTVLTYGITDVTGRFAVPCDSKDVIAKLSCVGYKTNYRHFDSFNVGTIKMEELPIKLKGVTVSADRSQSVKRTSNGYVFYLSKKAMKEHNPFLALAEIPLIISDYTTSSIKLIDGNQPLILIDGNHINSGINPIQPSDIESVEVMTTVPARYLQDGYSGIVNIRLKKNRDPYVWFGGSYNQSIPASSISGPTARFEIGNEKFSVYGAAIYHYTRDEKISSDVNRNNTGYSQIFSSNSKSRSDRLYGWLLLKYIASPKDYLAASIRYNEIRRKSESASIGFFTDITTYNYMSDEALKNNNGTLSTNLYYKHSFSDYNDLELNIGFNTDANRMNNSNTETIGNSVNDIISVFHNSRYSGYVYADYSKTWSNGKSISVGNHLKITKDKINQITLFNPIFENRTISEYFYGSFASKVGNLLYNLSGGIEYIGINAANEGNAYIRPRISVSGTWNFNYSNSLNLAYTLTNQAPSIMMLNPLNTSTDPLVVISGNPHLKPKMEHNIKATYTFNKRGWYISPLISYYNSRDLMAPWGYSENGVFYSTYRNSGHYSEMNYQLNISYNHSWLSLTAAAGPCAQYFQNTPVKWSTQAYMSLFARVKKFYFIAELNYISKKYTDISLIKYHNPIESRLHISYNFTPDFYVAIGMKNYIGNVKTATKINQGTFNSLTTTVNRGDGRGFIPYISIYYNFRKNNKRKIEFNNPNFEEESGILLKTK